MKNGNQKGNRYGFNKDWKLDQHENGLTTIATASNNGKFQPNATLFSVKPCYLENMKILMKYAKTQEKPIDLTEKNKDGKFVHEDILQSCENAHEIDTIMFNELMSMITGDLSITRYISQNVKRSGLEI